MLELLLMITLASSLLAGIYLIERLLTAEYGHGLPKPSRVFGGLP
jgi:hypothetical protein